MKQSMEKIKKILFASLSVLIVMSSWGQSFAVGPIEPTGPQQPTGRQETNILVGPQGVTGNIEPVGPQEPTGPQEMAIPIEEEVSTQDIKETTNDQTGPNSENQNSLTNETDVNINETNNANIDNNLEIDLSSGENNINQNSVVGSLETGSIEGTINVLNVGNSTLGEGSSVGTQTIDGSNTNEIVLGTTTNRASLNTTTGPNSSNTNLMDSNNFVTIVTENNASADNVIDIDANTGDNTIYGNTKVGNIETGDITLGVNLINILNVNNPNLVLTVDVWSILGDYEGDIVLPQLGNTYTGPSSSNSNINNINNSIDVEVQNNADISNNFDFETSTGGNNIGSNTVLGNVSTGGTVIDGSVANLANINTPAFYIFNVYGTWDGSYMGLDPSKVIINQINDTTGPGSDNQNQTNINNQTNASINNNATSNSLIKLDANTGNNAINSNSVIDNISTGAITLGANVVNILNSFGNDVGNFSLGVINIFGNWKGNVKNEPRPELLALNREIDNKPIGPVVKSGGEKIAPKLSINDYSEPETYQTIRNNDQDLVVPQGNISSSTGGTDYQPFSANNRERVATIDSSFDKLTLSEAEQQNKVSDTKASTTSSNTSKDSRLPFSFTLLLPICSLILLLWIFLEIITRKYQLKKVSNNLGN